MTTTQRMAATACAFVLAAFGTAVLAQTTDRTGGGWSDIKVHGHWTIDIKNPDGALHKRHEFENELALLGDGPLTLVNILARQWKPGLWAVDLLAPPSEVQCLPSGQPAGCVLSELGWGTNSAGNLIVSVPSSGPNLGKLVLAGSLTSPVAQTFTRALTRVYPCTAGVTICPSSHAAAFTVKDFAPIAVQAGQAVQVTVVISFS